MTEGMARAVPFCLYSPRKGFSPTRFLFSEIDKACLYGTMSLDMILARMGVNLP